MDIAFHNCARILLNTSVAVIRLIPSKLQGKSEVQHDYRLVLSSDDSNNGTDATVA